MTCGISRGGVGIGSSGCDVEVVGMWCAIVCAVNIEEKCRRGGGAEWRRGRRLGDATKGTASADHG